MIEYTPSDEVLTWEDIRRRWAASEFADSVGPGEWAYEHSDFGPLDRWLLAERARIWDEGARAGALSERTQFGRKVSYEPLVNPYRKEGDA